MKYIASEPGAELVAIADLHLDLVDKAKSQVPASVKFYPDCVKRLDEAKPEAVFVTTENDRHLEILRECAKRHIHYSTEKPMATNAADAREIQRLAEQTGIKLMVNYWNDWAASSHDLFHRGEVRGHRFSAEDHRAVWAQRAERDRRLEGIRRLAL